MTRNAAPWEEAWNQWKQGEGAHVIRDFEDFIANRDLSAAAGHILNAHEIYSGGRSEAEKKEVDEALKLIACTAAMEQAYHGVEGVCQTAESETPEDDFGFEEPEDIFEDYAQFEWEQRQLLSQDPQPDEEKTAREFLEHLTSESIFFAHDNSGYGFPWCFAGCEEKFSVLCSMLGIELPPAPAPDDWQGQFSQYYRNCGALFRWRRARRMTPAQMWALFCGFLARR